MECKCQQQTCFSTKLCNVLICSEFHGLSNHFFFKDEIFEGNKTDAVEMVVKKEGLIIELQILKGNVFIEI